MDDSSNRGIPNRVLIILLGSIGDVVRALPLLGRMREAWPSSHLAWAVEPKSAPILRGHPWIDQLIVYERDRAPWSFAPFLWKIRHGRFDLVVDLQRHLKSGISSLASGARERLGFAEMNVKEFNHWFSTRRIEPQPPMRLKLTQYQAFGDLLGLAPVAISFGLEPSVEGHRRTREIIGEIPRPRVGVILGSSWPSRIYFAESIAATIRELAQPGKGSPGFFPILIGGPEDSGLALRIAHEVGATAMLNLAGRTGLGDLPGIFAACDAAFGPDSGPMHIAAAVGCPVVSLWGATAPERSAPWGFAEFALRGAIPCSPCYLRHCPVGRECIRRITPESVAAAVRRAAAMRDSTAFVNGSARASCGDLVRTGGVENIECDGWRLTLAIPESAQKIREELLDQVEEIAAGHGGASLRRSRRATTFNLRFRAKTDGAADPVVKLDLFVKVMDPPRGIDQLKRRLRGSTAAHVARITTLLAAAGVAAPPVWIHGYAIDDGRELIVTPRAEGRGPLRALKTLSLMEKRRVLRALGAEIAQMHRAGFVHGDLTPFNIFVVTGQPTRFIFLDHERTSRNFVIGGRRRALRNLVQLGRFGLPRITRADRLRVIGSYALAMRREARKLSRQVNAMLERRLRNDDGFTTVAPLCSPPPIRSDSGG